MHPFCFVGQLALFLLSYTLSFFRIMRRTRLCYVKLLKILVALLRQQRNTCAWCWRWTVSWRQVATSFGDVMANYHPPEIAGEVGCTSSNAQWAFPTALEEIRCRPHWRDLTSMFMTIGDADTLCHPQLFRPVTFESQLAHFHDRPFVPVPSWLHPHTLQPKKFGVSLRRIAWLPEFGLQRRVA